MRLMAPHSFFERFEAKVDRAPGYGPDGECHVWTASVSKDGYGKFGVTRRIWKGAHRVAWLIEYGEWPPGSLRHTCDNPPCVRLDHLCLGTQADNIADMVDRGRQSRGSERSLAKLIEADIPVIRALKGIELQRVTAVRYGVCKQAISQVQRRTSWLHVPEQDEKPAASES